MQRYKTSVHLIINNGAAWLPWCLESLYNQTKKEFFLLVIDNGSIDNSYKIVLDFFNNHKEILSRVRLIRNKNNLGFARAHNQAISWTESEYVLVLNQDVYLTSNYLARLSDDLDNQERAAAMTGKMLSWQFQSETFHSSDFDNHSEKIIDSLGLMIKRSRQVINKAQGQVDDNKSQIPQRIFGVPATAALYRRRALAAVSPDGQVFDEDFVSYKEDVDLAWRLQLAGFEAWLDPAVIAYHDRSLSSGSDMKSEYKLRQQRPRDLKVYSWVNHWAVLIKNDGFINFWRDFPWIAIHEITKGLFLLLTDPFTLIKGKLRLFSLLGKFYKKRQMLKVTHKISYSQLRYWWSRVKSMDDNI